MNFRTGPILQRRLLLQWKKQLMLKEPAWKQDNCVLLQEIWERMPKYTSAGMNRHRMLLSRQKDQLMLVSIPLATGEVQSSRKGPRIFLVRMENQNWICVWANILLLMSVARERMLMVSTVRFVLTKMARR